MGVSPESPDAVHKLVNAIGATWRQQRRAVPLVVEEHVLHLLIVLQPFVLPDSAKSTAANVREARSDVRTMLAKMQQLASPGAVTEVTRVQVCEAEERKSEFVPEVLPFLLRVPPPPPLSLHDTSCNGGSVITLESLPVADTDTSLAITNSISNGIDEQVSSLSPSVFPYGAMTSSKLLNRYAAEFVPACTRTAISPHSKDTVKDVTLSRGCFALPLSADTGPDIGVGSSANTLPTTPGKICERCQLWLPTQDAVCTSCELYFDSLVRRVQSLTLRKYSFIRTAASPQVGGSTDHCAEVLNREHAAIESTGQESAANPSQGYLHLFLLATERKQVTQLASASWAAYSITKVLVGGPLPGRGFKPKRYKFCRQFEQQLTFATEQDLFQCRQQLVRRQIDSNGYHSYSDAPEESRDGGAVPHDCNHQ